ncbi:MAG TPA: M4 family metallopeptidase, partial [Candidatus Limnocylindrales bacterium]|nr:M4 family metallopeptidase [Candidatus Limnocylindrales bacterium]
LVTRDARGNSRLWDLVDFSDSDNAWAAATQRAAVDAQYYASKTDGWYLAEMGFDLLAEHYLPSPVEGQPAMLQCDLPAITSVVHYDDTPGDGFGYDNAFWHPEREIMVYGDGDGVETGPFSGAQDVVSHELSHAVTTCRAPLTYYSSSGALNEGFSDIMAAAMEWEFAEPNSSGCRRLTSQTACPDWWIGEDSIITGTNFGFRNLARPQSTYNNPSHWADRYRGSFDNRGVHYNSLLPGHAFYLMSMGGRNARCVGATDTKADCDVVVPSIGIEDAAHLFFNAWGTLPEDADYCDAQAATIVAAQTVFPGSDLHLASAVLGWAAVGPRTDYPNAIGNACSGNLPKLTLNTRSVALAGGQSAAIDVTNLGQFEALSVSAQGPVTAELVASDPDTVLVSVPEGTAPGAYYLMFTGTTASVTTTRYAVGTVVVDATPPTASVTQVALIGSGQIAQSGTIQLQVSWSAADDLSGVADADLEWTTTGSEPWPVLVGTPPANGQSAVIVGGNEYSFRVRALDGVGHETLSQESGPWRIERSQENAATYTKAWIDRAVADYWGGGSRSAKAKGATATFSFNGTAVQWITNRGQKRGKAKIYLDGVFVTRVDLYSSSASNRRIGYTVNGLTDGNHTLIIWVMGTTNRPRVDIDGFVVLDR